MLRIYELAISRHLDVINMQDCCILFQKIPLHFSLRTHLPSRPDEVEFLSVQVCKARKSIGPNDSVIQWALSRG